MVVSSAVLGDVVSVVLMRQRREWVRVRVGKVKILRGRETVRGKSDAEKLCSPGPMVSP